MDLLKKAIIVVSFFSFFNGLGQEIPQASREFLYSKTIDQKFEIIQCKTDEILVLKNSLNKLGEMNNLEIAKLDTLLRTIWQTKFDAGIGFTLVGNYVSNDQVHFFFNQSQKNNIKILTIDLKDGESKFDEFSLLTQMVVNNFSYMAGRVVVGGEIDGKPVVEVVKLFDKSKIVLPNIFERGFTMHTVKLNPKEQEILVVLTNEKKMHQIFAYIRYQR